MNIEFRASALRIPLKGGFKQASFDRRESESIWVEASRQGLKGYGEGCPRIYVTAEELDSSLAWISSMLNEVSARCYDLDSLTEFVHEHEKLIDAHPAAWCALELAMLDLFAREQKVSVEKLFGLPEVSTRSHSYTAVLSDDEPEVFLKKLQRFKQIGFEQYKVKVSGDLKRDAPKFDLIRQELNGMPHTLRIDANNLWDDNVHAAVQYVNALNCPLIGIEAPFAHRKFKEISELSKAVKTSIILDESGATCADLQEAVDAGADVILNIKVSKAGGALRSMAMVDLAKDLDIQIIIGAHVGETSLLTRAAMLIASYAGNSLIGQEGGFGEHLIERDKAQPVVQIGAGGKITLNARYSYPDNAGPVQVAVDTWNFGWGLTERG
jgi:L-alanine-DL-glutamate epimerase-like enolase superfamily enzyme